jgi:RNA recognition motif-containing protein
MSTPTPVAVEQSNKLYVGNLAYSTTEEQLKKFFADCADV